MKKSILILAIALSLAGTLKLSYAGDEEWATAGKVLAVVEGVRVITGGNVDVIGNVAGINKNKGLFSSGNSHPRRYESKYKYVKNYTPNKIWVPHYMWKEKYIPEHEEYDPEYGHIIISGHTIKYKFENGGHWEYK